MKVLSDTHTHRGQGRWISPFHYDKLEVLTRWKASWGAEAEERSTELPVGNSGAQGVHQDGSDAALKAVFICGVRLVVTTGASERTPKADRTSLCTLPDDLMLPFPVHNTPA